jgi:hypothetical protein
MNFINFGFAPAIWQNNSKVTIAWTNSSSATIGWLGQALYNYVNMADFVKVTITPSLIYYFATTPSPITVPGVGTFTALGSLIKVNEVQRDIKSTANETSVTLIGIDTSVLGWVLDQKLKGCLIEMWHGFFDNTGALITLGGTNGLYKFFTGYINTFQISEQWLEEARTYVGTVTVNASSIQIILQNRIAGTYTNNNAWTYWYPTDTSMARVGVVQQANFQFGKTA